MTEIQEAEYFYKKAVKIYARTRSTKDLRITAKLKQDLLKITYKKETK